jgi:hypothetical protein
MAAYWFLFWTVTGIEALFADLAHFPVLAVQIAFTVVVFPCLLLAYSGQAAYLMQNKEHVVDAFYRSIPGKNSFAVEFPRLLLLLLFFSDYFSSVSDILLHFLQLLIVRCIWCKHFSDMQFKNRAREVMRAQSNRISSLVGCEFWGLHLLYVRNENL